MSEFKITIMVPLTLTAEDIDDVMITASESGYEWVGDFKKTDDGWHLTVEDAEEPGWWIDRTVGYYKLAEAVQQFFNARPPRISFGDELAHQTDASDADSIMQLAVYNEIVFG